MHLYDMDTMYVCFNIHMLCDGWIFMLMDVYVYFFEMDIMYGCVDIDMLCDGLHFFLWMCICVYVMDVCS